MVTAIPNAGWRRLSVEHERQLVAYWTQDGFMSGLQAQQYDGQGGAKRDDYAPSDARLAAAMQHSRTANALKSAGVRAEAVLRAYYAPATFLTPVVLKVLEPFGRSGPVMLYTVTLEGRLRRCAGQPPASLLALLKAREKARDPFAVDLLGRIRREADEMLAAACASYASGADLCVSGRIP